MIRAECIAQFSYGNPTISCSKRIEKIEELAPVNQWDDHLIINNMKNQVVNGMKSDNSSGSKMV